MRGTLSVSGPKSRRTPRGMLQVHAVVALLTVVLMWAPTPADSPVADAAMAGDVEQVRELLGSGADVNASQGDGMTALHWAAENGDPRLAEMLVAAGADIAAVTRLGDYTPLHLATRAGRAAAPAVVEVLLQAGADAQAITSTGGATPLYFAAGAGSTESVAALLEHGALIDVGESTWHQTPLMFAAVGGREDVVRALLAAGADPAITSRVMDMDQRERDDRADRQAPSAVVSNGPPPDGGRGGVALQGEPTKEEADNLQRDRVPSSRYSQAQLVGGYGGFTALHLAVRDGQALTVMALLEGGADINQVSDGDHTTPLLMATINGHFDLAAELFERGADPNITSDANATPLYTTLNTQWIPKSRHPQPVDYMQQQVTYLELMETFLEAGVEVNVRLDKQLWFTTFGDDYLRIDRMGATPFWRAAYALDLSAMRLLIEYGADPDIPTMKTAPRRFGAGGIERTEGTLDPSGLEPVPLGGPGAWPIHAASGIGYGEGFAANIHRVVPGGWLPALRYLVEELGADVNARDHNGYTALHHAAARGDEDTIRYLVDHGADVLAVSRKGQTTVDMANGPVQRISPFPSTIALLESLGARNNHSCVSCQ